MMPTDRDVVQRWRHDVVARAVCLEAEADHGGHQWHSLWAGFVIGLGRPDLSGWMAYRRLGFPVEMDRR